MLYTSYPYAVGLTGGIASGKSTASSFFKKHGIEIISADAIARELTAKDTPALDAIASHFGPGVLTQDNELNRKALREKIMNNADEKCWLEAYLHPQIRVQIEATLKHAKSPYAVVEIPLLIRRDDFPYLNHVLLLEIDEAHQLERLMARDQCSREDAFSMISIQPDKTLQRALADDIIQNDGNTQHFECLLQALHERYLKQAQETTSRGIKN